MQHLQSYSVFSGVDAGETDEKEEKKRQKRGGKAAHKTVQAKKAPQRITLSKAPRGKRKMVTVVTGLATFGICLPLILYYDLIVWKLLSFSYTKLSCSLCMAYAVGTAPGQLVDKRVNKGNQPIV